MTTMTNDIVDFNLEDLEDLPEFLVLPAGAYKLEGVSLTQRQDPQMGTIVDISVKVLQTLELKNPATDAPVADGTEITYGFPLTIMDKQTGALNERSTKFSQGALKVFTKPLAAHYGVTSFAALMEKFPGTVMDVVTTVRVDKEDKEKKYGSVKTVVVA